MLIVLLYICAVWVVSVALSEPEWWKSNILYQIYPRSFADTNCDGSGDLRGIIERLSYLKSIGVGMLWLSPIYASPWKDMGYDVSDYRSVHPKLGTLEDAKELIEKCHSHGIRILMDLVPNHSSDTHPWFNASRQGVSPEKDFYVWKDPAGWVDGKPVKPNNWLSTFGGSAWEFDEVRRQFYLHQFGEYQIDLNYTNPNVVEEMKDNLRFWLDLGVDGFRVDTPSFMAEDPSFNNEPWIPDCTPRNRYDCLDHIYTNNQPRTFEVLREFQELIVQEYNSDKYLILETNASLDIQKNYYGPLMSPFNFQLINDFWFYTDAIKLNGIITSYLENVPEGMWPNWVLGNHDTTRAATRLGEDMVDSINMLILLLPGTPITYQGEEIGMVDGHLMSDQLLDCCGRDPQRTPMQWNTNHNSGFSESNKTWLPLNTNFWRLNAQCQELAEDSHLNIYRRLALLKKSLDLSTSLETAAINRWVFTFKREHKSKTIYVIINLNNVEESVTLKNAFPKIPNKICVYIASGNAAYKAMNLLYSDKPIHLRPRSGLVLKT